MRDSKGEGIVIAIHANSKELKEKLKGTNHPGARTP